MVNYKLNDKQRALLAEAAQASGTYVAGPPQSSVVWALQTRGLVTSSYARGGGTAVVVTADGRFFLKHGRHPKEVEAEKARLKKDPAEAALAPVDGADLIARIIQAGGAVTVPDPGPGTRNRWKAAYYHALHHGHVPEGSKLRFAGRDRGDVVVRLLDEAAQRAEQPPVVPAVEVPQQLPERPHPLVARAAKTLGRSPSIADSRGRPDAVPIHVSRPLADRTLRIAQAVITEAERRGHEVAVESELVRGEALHRLVIRVRGHAYPWEITERSTKAPHEPTPLELRRKKREPWFRIPAQEDVLDGRLMIATPLGSGYRALSFSYSDAARWTLESRLGHFLRDVEQAAAQAEEQRVAAENRERTERQRWYQVVREARAIQIRKNRIQALTQQVERWRTAEDIRAYCTQAESRHAGALPVATAEWLVWARGYADTIDPLTTPPPAPPNPPATVQEVGEHLRGDLHKYPWPYDRRGQWARDIPHPEQDETAGP